MGLLKFLSEGDTPSSMRLVLFVGCLSACILLLGALFNIMWNTTISAEIKWSEISIFIGAIAAFMGTLLYGKVQQKKIEK